VAVLLLAGCTGAPPGDLIVSGAWVRASSGADQPSAGYMTIVNNTGRPQKLIGVYSPLAASVEMHRTSTDSMGMTQMAPVGEINVPAGGTVTLEPGGFHLMLMGLKSSLPAGSPAVPLTLTFEPAGNVDVEADVRAIGP
jgi:copper(I)-binding protein